MHIFSEVHVPQNSQENNARKFHANLQMLNPDNRSREISQEEERKSEEDATDANEMNIDSAHQNFSSANQSSNRHESSISNLNRRGNEL